jgi:hypothetical protein
MPRLAAVSRKHTLSEAAMEWIVNCSVARELDWTRLTRLGTVRL